MIYVRAVLELLRSEIPVHGLAHITGGGLTNLLRIGRGIGYEISAPLPVPPVFTLIAERGGVATAEMWEVFNMGCGFCCVVPDEHARAAVDAARTPPPRDGADRLGHRRGRSGDGAGARPGRRPRRDPRRISRRAYRL